MDHICIPRSSFEGSIVDVIDMTSIGILLVVKNQSSFILYRLTIVPYKTTTGSDNHRDQMNIERVDENLVRYKIIINKIINPSLFTFYDTIGECVVLLFDDTLYLLTRAAIYLNGKLKLWPSVNSIKATSKSWLIETPFKIANIISSEENNHLIIIDTQGCQYVLYWIYSTNSEIQNSVCFMELNQSIIPTVIFANTKKYLHYADQNGNLCEIYCGVKSHIVYPKESWIGNSKGMVAVGEKFNMVIRSNNDKRTSNWEEKIENVTDYQALRKKGILVVPLSILKTLTKNNCSVTIKLVKSSFEYIALLAEHSELKEKHIFGKSPYDDSLPFLLQFFNPRIEKYDFDSRGIIFMVYAEKKIGAHWLDRLSENVSTKFHVNEYTYSELFTPHSIDENGVLLVKGSEAVYRQSFDGRNISIYKRDDKVKYANITYSTQNIVPKSFILRIREEDVEETIRDPLTWYLIAYLQKENMELHVQIPDNIMPRYPCVKMVDGRLVPISYCSTDIPLPEDSQDLFSSYLRQTYKPYVPVEEPENSLLGEYLGDHGDGTTRDFLSRLVCYLGEQFTTVLGNSRQFHCQNYLINSHIFPDLFGILGVIGSVMAYYIWTVKGHLPFSLPIASGFILDMMCKKTISMSSTDNCLELISTHPSCESDMLSNYFNQIFTNINTADQIKLIGDDEDQYPSLRELHLDYLFGSLAKNVKESVKILPCLIALLTPISVLLPSNIDDPYNINYWLSGSIGYVDRNLFISYLKIYQTSPEGLVSVDNQTLTNYRTALKKLDPSRFVKLLEIWSARRYSINSSYYLIFQESHNSIIETCFLKITLPVYLMNDPDKTLNVILNSFS
jgi:hypothetical protein